MKKSLREKRIPFALDIEDVPQEKSQQKDKFFAAAGKVNIDADAVDRLRAASML